jgi:uncharacterized OB-fold protein
VTTLALPVCEACGTVQFPPREACSKCLSDRITPRAVEAGGTLLARTAIHRSLEPGFQSQLPLAVGTVRLDCGVTAFAFLDPGCDQAGSRVRLREELRDGAKRLVAGREA